MQIRQCDLHVKLGAGAIDRGPTFGWMGANYRKSVWVLGLDSSQEFLNILIQSVRGFDRKKVAHAGIGQEFHATNM